MLRQEVEGLVDAMKSYSKYLEKKNSEVKEHHQSLEPSQSNDNASLVVLPATTGPISVEYVDLEEKLRLLPARFCK